MSAAIRWLSPAAPRDGVVAVAREEADALALVALRDPRAGHGAGTFLRSAVSGVLVAPLDEAAAVLRRSAVRDALLLYPAGRAVRARLERSGARFYAVPLPDGVTFAAWAARLPSREERVVRVADLIIASSPEPVGFRREVSR